MPCYDDHGEWLKQIKLHALTAMLCGKHPRAHEFAKQWRKAHHELESLPPKDYRNQFKVQEKLDAIAEEAYEVLCKPNS